MLTTESSSAPAGGRYLELVLANARGEGVLAIEATNVAFEAGVLPEAFHRDGATATRRVAARRAIDTADEVRGRADALRAAERGLESAENTAIANGAEALRVEFERRHEEMLAAARQPLLDFRAEHAAERAKLSTLTRAASDGRELLIGTADPKIDEAIAALQNAEPGIWGPFATPAGVEQRSSTAALVRLEDRRLKIAALRAMKLQPEHFEHAASSPWRSYVPGEAAS